MEKKIKVLLNALNARKISGGTYQVCLNFIQHTLTCNNSNIEWVYVVSLDIDNALDIKPDNSYFVFSTQPDLKSYLSVRRKLTKIELSIKPDLVYSISAPSYFRFHTIEVMRHTNPWVTHPNKYAKQKVDWKTLLRLYFVCSIKKQLLKNGDYFITQSQCSKDGIQNITGVDEKKISVIPNVLPAYFYGLKYDRKIENSIINIACVTVPHPHKNLDIIPDVLLYLKNNHNIENIIFHLTIPEHNTQWIKIAKKIQQYGLGKNVINHGYCTQQQLVDIYLKCKMAFVPTLLETFSAAPLEAMFFQCYIVASNLNFNYDVTGDAALYFNPMDAKDAASKIYQVLTDKTIQIQLKQNMLERIKLFDNYERHYKQTIDFLVSIVHNRNNNHLKL